MNPTEAVPDLRQRLLALGFDFDRPDLQVALQAFRAHLEVPMSGVSDYVMVQVGTYDFPTQPIRPAFAVDLTRQFGHFEDGEFSHYEQLHLVLYAPATAHLNDLRMSEFCDEGEDRGPFLDSAERSQTMLAARGVVFTACATDSVAGIKVD